jgi:hypothetical protein
MAGYFQGADLMRTDWAGLMQQFLEDRLARLCPIQLFSNLPRKKKMSPSTRGRPSDPVHTKNIGVTITKDDKRIIIHRGHDHKVWKALVNEQKRIAKNRWSSGNEEI